MRASAINNYANLKNLYSAQKGVALRVISACRTVSTSAVLVLARVRLIDTLAMKRQEADGSLMFQRVPEAL